MTRPLVCFRLSAEIYDALDAKAAPMGLSVPQYVKNEIIASTEIEPCVQHTWSITACTVCGVRWEDPR